MITMLSRRIPKTLIDTLTDTGDNSSDVYAIPHVADGVITWQSIVVGTPSAISLQLLGAMNSGDTFTELDASANVSGEMRHVSPVNVRFIKVRQVSRTSGTSVSIQVLVN